MTPPISTDACTATVSAPQQQQQQQPSSLTSLFMDDFDQFMLKDLHSDFNLFNQHHDLNATESDLFQFDKMNTFTNNLFDLNNLNDPQNHQIMSFNSNVDEYDEDDDDKFNLDDDSEINQDFLVNLDDQDINETPFGAEFNNTNETLNAIREMAINEKQQQQLQHQLQAKHNRKHKNSTSSVSSVSMTSTIKKVAIELQNSTANIVSSYNLKQGSNIKSVPINYDYNQEEQQKTDLVDNFLDDDNDFEDLLGLDDWEQMLDEDCISRLTADFNFNTNNVNTKPQTPKKSQSNQPLVLVLSNNSTPSSSSSPSSLSSSNLSSPNYKTKTPITQITKLAPSKMVTTSNVVKKMNSVVLNEQPKLNTNSNKNIILKNKTNNVITTVNQNSSLISAKAKSLTKPLTGSMINATAQTISIIKSPVKKQIISPSNQCDYSDIIDCVNPDQIFPYRLPLLRFIKSEIDEQETDRLNDEEEDEEEIDVVSVNHSYGSVNNLNNEHSLLNLNHHNYFHSVNKNLKTNQQQKQKNQVVLLKNINDTDYPASNSLLANYLKQSNSSKTQQMQPIVTKTIKQQTVIETKKQNFIKTTKLNSTNSIIKPSAQIQQRKSLQQAKKTMNNKPTGQQQVNSIRIVANQKNDLVTKLQPTVNLNKDILVQPSTKFITMTSKIQQQQQQPVKCQTITPTTNKPVINQVPKIITTQNSFLKLNNFTNSTNLTAIKLTTNTNTSLNKLNTTIKKAPLVTNTKIKSPEQDTFDDEFYYEDEDFNRRLNASTNKVNKIKKEDYDDDDLDDDDLDDDDLDDDSSTSSTPSPGSSSSLLTSSGTSSGYSTPTKNKTKLDQKDSFDLNALNEKLNKKSINKKKTSTLSSVSSSSSLTLITTSKRNSRLSSMGYSSDNPAEKRAFHILSERQRRNDLKKLFETLRINIPALCDKQKASKLTILKAAVDHLAEVTNKKEKLCTIFEKEKQKHLKLMQQLKTYNNGQQPLTTLVH